MQEGVEGLLRDKKRPAGKSPITTDRARAVVELTLKQPPHEATHWTSRAMAKASGLAVSTVQRIWKAHGLAPHGWRSFKLSTDPAFAEKLHDIVGLYAAPPAHAVVLSVDEKSQIQALDRTQPGLSLKKGRGATMTNDYKRHGTTTLFAALNVLTGEVFGRNMQSHRHQGFIRFLNALERDIPAGKVVHVILDNYAAHKHEKVRAWLARHSRWSFHFTPTSSSCSMSEELLQGRAVRLVHGTRLQRLDQPRFQGFEIRHPLAHLCQVALPDFFDIGARPARCAGQIEESADVADAEPEISTAPDEEETAIASSS